MLNVKQLETIMQLQEQLDNKIMKVRVIKNGHNATLTARFLALIVEIAEFANEQRCFKYWSSKPASEKNVLLEEYIDGFHFIISIANSLKLPIVNCEVKLTKYKDLNLAFIELFSATIQLFTDKNLLTFNKWINIYYSIGHFCHFNGDDIFKGYLAKNKINHQRQEQNY